MAESKPVSTVVCPTCRVQVQAGFLDQHLRRLHHLYSFRGLARPWNETLTALLAALLAPRPDLEAWRLLVEFAREQQGARTDPFLAATLGQALARLSVEARSVVVESLARVIAAKDTIALTATLASDGEIAARHLALMVVGRLPVPLDASLLPPLRGLLLDRRLPVEAHFSALANVLRGMPKDHPLAAELIEKLVSGLGKSRSIDRLHEFEQRIGPHPAIDGLVNRLEERLRMNCPRCGVQMRRPRMIQHLWDDHRLVLEGRRVKEPWTLIEEWLNASAMRANPEVVERCRELAQRVDPEGGLARVQRLFLAHGQADPETKRTLVDEAREHHAGVCPWCFAQVPAPIELPAYVVSQREGRITSHGYVVDVSDRHIRTSLEVRTPDKLLSKDHEPGRVLTMLGARALMVGPIVVVAALCSFFMPGAAQMVPFGFVIGLLLVALGVEILVRMFWVQPVPASERALEYTWQLLAPRLHADGFKLEDSAFAAGLAQMTPAGRAGMVRAPLLFKLAKETEQAVQKRLAPPDHLVALRRLMIADSVNLGADPIPLVVDQLARCFEGKVPLSYAERLLSDWEADWWSKGNLARLRILLCDRAFEAGFEVRNLLDAGQSAPALAEVLKTNEEQGLAALRLLWSLRATQPWDRNGAATTAFETAADPARSRLLAAYPDLLLWQEESRWQLSADGGREKPLPAQILLCVRGVVLQEIVFTQTPPIIEVINKSIGFDLVVGEERFSSSEDVDELARRMERWFRYWFNDFLPTMKNVVNWKPPDRVALLRAWGASSCPECHKYLLARVGEVGIALDENVN